MDATWTHRTRTGGRRSTVRPAATTWRWSNFWWSRAPVCLPPHCPTTRRPPKSVRRMRRASTAARSIYTVSRVLSVASDTSGDLFASHPLTTISTALPLGIQEKLGILNKGDVYAVFSYDSQQPDELSFDVNDQLTILRKGDDAEREWWWARIDAHGNDGREGYVPRNLLGVRHVVTLRTTAITSTIPLDSALTNFSHIRFSFTREFRCSNHLINS